MPSLVIKAVKRAGAGFDLFVTHPDGLEESHSFESRRDARQQMRYMLDNEAVRRILVAAAICNGLRATADTDTADDLDALIGKTITFNPRASRNLLTIT